MHLGNIAQCYGQMLNVEPANGRIINNREASKYWSRVYEPVGSDAVRTVHANHHMTALTMYL